MTITKSDLTISLESHLVDTLKPLQTLLPPPLASELAIHLTASGSESSSPTIPYSLLTSISSWARTSEGKQTLRACNPELNPSDYTMISLLAGTRTSPDRKFPVVPAARSPLEDARREVNDRRAVTAIVNALLSIGGSGVATWWAAGRLSWKDEWKVLFALLVASVVAISESILYMIWDARLSGRPLIIRSKASTSSQKRVNDRDSLSELPGPEKTNTPRVLSSTATSSAVDIDRTLRGRNISSKSRNNK